MHSLLPRARAAGCVCAAHAAALAWWDAGGGEEEVGGGWGAELEVEGAVRADGD